MIDPKKQYRTRDGREVRIYAVDGSLERTVHGAWKDPDGDWILDSWHKHGFHRRANDSPLDLIEVRPRIKRKVWVNVYPLHVGFRTYETKSAAISNKDHGCIACVEIDIDVEEGHGL